MAGTSSSEPPARGTATAAGRYPSPGVDTADWPVQAADTIERVVQNVRDKTTGPAINAARWLVAGVLLLIPVTMVVVLLIVLLARLLNVYLPESVFGEDHMWAAYLILGGVISVVGLVLLSKRSSAPSA